MITLVAPCAVGAEKVLSNELTLLGYRCESRAAGRVVFSPTCADQEDLMLAEAYRANLSLRIADRIYLRLAHFPCKDFETLFEGVKTVRWQDWFKKDMRIVVDKVRTFKSTLNSEHSIQGVVHKAIYSVLGTAWKMTTLPETGLEATIRVYILNNTVSILLDLSGMPLHRRGYRTAGGEAPIRETLAAVLLQLMAWKRKTPLHDAFCGSGTIPVEAVLYAHNIAPGLGRSFALETLAPWTSPRMKALLDAERKKAALAIRTDCLVRVTGSDIDQKILVSAAANAERACVTAGRALQEAGRSERIPRPDFTKASFDELAAPYDTGMIISNPPFGERLGDKESAFSLYASMKQLRDTFPSWDMGFITSHEDFERAFERRADKKKDLKSGNLNTRFYMYKQGE